MTKVSHDATDAIYLIMIALTPILYRIIYTYYMHAYISVRYTYMYMMLKHFMLAFYYALVVHYALVANYALLVHYALVVHYA